ncbi:hypothetical protein C0J52_17347 [Blattella germanica]|nr:hypothetical protein C0J52_17347 [Blattella germanica]
MKLLITVLLTILFLLGDVDSSRILALFPYNAKSHFFMYEKLLKALAARGHEVVVLGHFPQKKPIENYKDIDVRGTLPEIINSFTLEMIDNESCMTFPYTIILEHIDMCKSVLNHTAVKELIHSQEKFDLIISEIFGSDCLLGFVHKFKVPFIGVISSFAFPWANSRLGLPDNPAYIQNYFLPYTDRMSFKQRLINTVHSVYLKWMYHQYSDIVTYEIAKQFFGKDLPPLWEIAKNTSLVLSNSYFSVNQPRPTVPGFIEVGGLHVTEAQKLPKMSSIKMFK